MTNKTKAAIEEAAKLPTANELIDENLGGLELTMDDDMWKFYKDVIRQCIESHTQAHTDGLRAALSGIVEAWEALPEGHYTPKEIQKWIVKEMHPSIVKAREVLK